MEMYIDRAGRVYLFSSKHYELSIHDYSKTCLMLLYMMICTTYGVMLNIIYFQQLVIIINIGDKFKRHNWS